MLLAATLLAAAVPLYPAGAARRSGGDRAVAPYAKAGPYAAGVTTLDVGGIPVDVWYPAAPRSVKGHERATYRLTDWVPSGYDGILATIPPGLEPAFRTNAYRDVRASKDGPFPLVTYAHGYGGFRDASTFLTTHLASWGFVVAAPDLPESSLTVELDGRLGRPVAPPGTDAATLASAVDAVRAASKNPGGVLAGTVRRGPFAAMGHSMGVHSSMQLANEGGVAGYVALDGSNRSLPTDYPDQSLTQPPDIPSMYLSTGWVVSDYELLPGPKRLVLMPQSTHVTGFTDVCRIGERDGGVVEIARRAGLGLVTAALEETLKDCTLFPSALRSARLQPVTKHYVTAALRDIFGIDRRPVGLDARTARRFRGVDVQTYNGRYRPPGAPPGNDPNEP